MKINELMRPPADETSGEILTKAPLAATQIGTGGAQKQMQIPKGSVLTLVKKLPQKKTVMFAVGGKRFVATEQDWGNAVQL